VGLGLLAFLVVLVDAGSPLRRVAADALVPMDADGVVRFAVRSSDVGVAIWRASPRPPWPSRAAKARRPAGPSRSTTAGPSPRSR